METPFPFIGLLSHQMIAPSFSTRLADGRGHFCIFVLAVSCRYFSQIKCPLLNFVDVSDSFH